MSFHSKDNQYVIDQIIFYDENSHTTYKLGNSQGTMNYYSWYKYKNKKASDQNRLGDFELMFFNSKQTLEKNPKEKDIKVEQETCDISSDKSKIYVHYVNKENNIKLNMFIDTSNIVLDSLKTFPWEECGCQVTAWADSGQTALEQLEHSAPDIMISDIRMPR